MLLGENLTKSYNGDRALDAVSLEFDSGEHAAVIGPSGAGKTTLLHVFGGLIQPDRGRVALDGRDIGTLSPGRELSRLVGVMHQQFDLVDQLPVIHNVLAGKLGEWGFWRSLFSRVFPQEKNRAYSALERLGIRDKAHQKTAHLSGGEQQRVALARLLVQQPRAILADEPVASVDPARARDLLATLVQIAGEEDLTLLVSLHSVELALEFFPRIVGLREGRVMFDRASDALDDPELDTLYELEGETTGGEYARK